MGYKPIYASEADVPPDALRKAVKSISVQAGIGGTILVLTFLMFLATRAVVVQPLVAGAVMIAATAAYAAIVGRMEDQRRDLRASAALVGSAYLLALVGAVVWLVLRTAPLSGGFLSYFLGLVGTVPVLFTVGALAPLASRDLARWLRDAPATAAPAADQRAGSARPPHLGGVSRDPRGPFA